MNRPRFTQKVAIQRWKPSGFLAMFSLPRSFSFLCMDQGRGYEPQILMVNGSFEGYGFSNKN